MCINQIVSLRAAVKLIKQLYKDQHSFTLTITYDDHRSDSEELS